MNTSKILIVDDELSIRIMLTRMLEPLGHGVYSAADGEMALDLVRQLGVDLVISDLMMPKMDGLSLLERVRKEGFDCAFIILTGFGDLPQALAARESFNISNFLVKPIHDMDQFLFDVESALSRRLLERDNRQLMDRLREANLQLEEKVRERTQELERKNRQLDRLSTFRADALKVLGHELRTPLAILSGYYGLARASKPKDVESLVPAMGGSIERLQQIVDQSLQLLQAGEAAEFTLNPSDVDPIQLCTLVAERILPFLAERAIVIATPVPCDSGRPPCRWDRDKMEIVIEELLINAVRASPDRSRIEISLRHDGGWVELSVMDRGIGIPPENREQIFEPFVTLGKVEHHSSGVFAFGAEGVGIGLSTARLWVHMHGGTIHAIGNDRGPGTTLLVRLPRNAAAVSGQAAVRDQDAAYGATNATEPQRSN